MSEYLGYFLIYGLKNERYNIFYVNDLILGE